VTGTPIRAGHAEKGTELLFGPQESIVPLFSRRLVVLGGSGGARSLNENVPRALYKIRAELNGWQIVHQSGEADFEMTRDLYGKFGLEARVVAFIPDVPHVLAASDLAVCRCGGTTLAELAVAGVPVILLPYPHATDDHQRKNAEVFTTAGGSLLLDQRELSGRLDDHLAGAISDLLADPAKRKRMSATMQRFARPGAAENVAAMILELVAGQSGKALPAAA
jgi:UDP-N-acetylglucosamine--N-acetylmuramyl-(pentapeptide) pyrophosphoryl-undecaprenol N-acetylglucosamine transferase